MPARVRNPVFHRSLAGAFQPLLLPQAAAMTRAASNPPASASSPIDPGETRIRIASPQDTLAIVPLLLGFHPRRSLAAMALKPPRGRVAFTMRVDVDLLPAAELAEMVAERLAHGEASEAIVVLYDPEHCVEAQSAEPG